MRANHFGVKPWMAKASSSSDQGKSKAAVLYFILGMLGFAIWGKVSAVENIPLDVYIAALVVTATCAFPIFSWYRSKQRSTPLFELIVLAFAVQFSMPVFTQANNIDIVFGTVRLEWSEVFLALLYTEAGVLALVVGYYFLGKRGLGSILPQVNLILHPNRRLIYIYLAVAFGSVFNLLTVMGRLAGNNAIILLISRQLSIAIVLLSIYVYRNQLVGRNLKFALYVATALAFLVGLTSGMIEAALTPLALLLIIRWEVMRHLPWRLVIFGVALFLILNPAKAEYRILVKQGKIGTSFTERVTVWSDLATTSANNLFSAANTGTTREATNSSLGRLDLLHRFAHVINMTPAIVPHYQGKTYTYLLSAVIPRVFWPNKPIASEWNNRLDIDYLLLSPTTSGTSIGIGLLAEAYANFGIIGIVGVMFTVGTLLGLLDNSFNSSNSEGGKAIYLSVIITFLNGIGTGTALLLGGLLQHIFASALILRMFVGKPVVKMYKKSVSV